MAAWLGKQALSRVGPALTGPGAQKLPLRQVLNLMALVFAIALFAALGALVQYVLGMGANPHLRRRPTRFA